VTDFDTCTSVLAQKIRGNDPENFSARRQERLFSLRGYLGPPTPTCPLGDVGPRLGGSRDGRSGYGLGTGLTVATAGSTSERVRRDFSLGSLSPPLSDKTEVTR
jgi:hypothetical protein